MRIRFFSVNKVLKLAAGILAGCMLTAALAPGVRADAKTGAYTSLSDLAGKKVGVQMGTIFDTVASENIPGAQVLYFSSFPDEVAALDAGRVDGVPTTKMIFSQFKTESAGYAIIEEAIGSVPTGYVFPKTDKGEQLKAQMDEFLADLTESGELEKLKEKWQSTDEDVKTIGDYAALPDINGSLTFVTEGTYPPFDYVRGGTVVGYDVDIAAMFCKEYGYALHVDSMSFDALMPAMKAGKYDFAASGIAITDERKESVLFSVPNIEDEIVVMVRSDGGGSQQTVPEYTSFDDLSGKTVSMLTGAPFEELVSSKVADVKEFTYFATMPDMVLAVKSGKSDACVMNNAVAELAANRDPELAVFPESLGDTGFGMAFAKGDSRLNEWQSAYESISEETKAALWTKWTGSDESVKKLPVQDWPGEGGIVRVAACDTLEPMSYAGEGGEVVGFDIEMLLLMAKELDVRVEITGMDFAAVLSGVQSGKADIGCGSIVVTEERKQAVDFIEYYPAQFVLIVRAESAAEAGDSGESGEDAPADTGLLGGIKESFEKTFIRENRWKLFLTGIGTTLLITVLSVLLGTALGFALYMACRNGNPAANKLTGFFVWLIGGMPVVVLLMILFYIIFGKTDISGTIVAIIGFMLVFGASVFGMLNVGVGAVDAGQMEAALALGYDERRAFYRVVLPQAVPHILPVYKGEIVSLIKATAIVGYIAVQDLTRMGDLIRSRTYEAFFPLIAVAVIYFILSAILTFIVEHIGAHFDWKSRGKNKILRDIHY